MSIALNFMPSLGTELPLPRLQAHLEALATVCPTPACTERTSSLLVPALHTGGEAQYVSFPSSCPCVPFLTNISSDGLHGQEMGKSAINRKGLSKLTLYLKCL